MITLINYYYYYYSFLMMSLKNMLCTKKKFDVKYEMKLLNNTQICKYFSFSILWIKEFLKLLERIIEKPNSDGCLTFVKK